MAQARGNDDLNYQTLRDFTGGLYERGNDRECPPNGLLALQDAYPLPTGGLRAAPAFGLEATTGITDVMTVPLGLYVSPRVPDDFATTGRRIYIGFATSPLTTVADVVVWRGIGNPVTSWALVRNHGDITSTNNLTPIPFVSYFSTVSVGGSSAVNLDYYSVRGVNTSFGVFAIEPSGDASTQVTAMAPLSLAVHQERLVGDNAGSTFPTTPAQSIIYTDPAGTTFNAFQAVGAYIPGGGRPIMSMHPSYPSDLVVLRWTRGVFTIQGTLPTVFVREAAINTVMARPLWGASTPHGTVVPTFTDGIWVFSGGLNADPLSRQIVGSPQFPSTGIIPGPSGQTWSGQVGYGNEFLFTPTGYTMDFRTGAWFKISYPQNINYGHWSYDQLNSRVFGFGLDTAAASNMRLISASLNEQTMTRAGSYVFTTPLQYVDGRPITLREAVLHIESYGPAQIQLDVIYRDPTGNEQTLSMPPAPVAVAGNHQIRILVGQQGGGSITTEAFKLRPTIRSMDGQEAPTLEKMVIGFVAAEARIP